MNSTPTKRKYSRRASYILAEYTVIEGTFRDVIKNISAGGIFIWSWRNIAIRQSIVLKFPLFQFENIIEVTGRVVRSDSKGFSVSFNEPIKGLIGKDGQLPDIVHEGNR